MMVGDSDPIVVIGAITTMITTVIGAVTASIAMLRTGQVHREVRTLNESSLGELGAAAETRRIGRVPLVDRTAKEKRHVEGHREETEVGTSMELPESHDVPPAS